MNIILIMAFPKADLRVFFFFSEPIINMIVHHGKYDP